MIHPGWKQALLRIEAPHFVAGALFVKEPVPAGHWICIEAAPIIHWLKSASPQFILSKLQWYKATKGWKWEWVESQSTKNEP